MFEVEIQDDLFRRLGHGQPQCMQARLVDPVGARAGRWDRTNLLPRTPDAGVLEPGLVLGGRYRVDVFLAGNQMMDDLKITPHIVAVLAKAILARAGIKDAERIFPILAKMGVFDVDENIELLRNGRRRQH